MSISQASSVRRPLLAGIVSVLVVGTGLGMFVLGPGKVLALIFWAESKAHHPARKITPDSTNENDSPSDSLELSPRVVELNKITTATAMRPTHPRLLEMRGSLGLDVSRFIHVRARFPGQVVELSTFDEASNGSANQPSIRRPLNFMDHVVKGQRLAVLKSKELGEKKSDLTDALSKLRVDRANLQALKRLQKDSAVSERSLREAERQVEVGEIAAERAEQTLESWLLTDEEIDAVKAEAERIHETGGVGAKGDPNWARVDVLAPSDGTILEKNVVEGDLIDSGQELFKIADLSVLTACAHVYEEDLAVLKSMPKPIEWSLRVNSDPSIGEIVGRIDRIGGIIDPSEHMGLLFGLVQNPNGVLGVGQFITATVVLPQVTGVVEIPTRALVEDGEESIVLVQLDPAKPRFTRRRVAVARRYHDVVYVRSQLTPQQLALGMEELHEGDRVVAAGALELKSAISEQRSRQDQRKSAPASSPQ